MKQIPIIFILSLFWQPFVYGQSDSISISIALSSDSCNSWKEFTAVTVELQIHNLDSFEYYYYLKESIDGTIESVLVENDFLIEIWYAENGKDYIITSGEHNVYTDIYYVTPTEAEEIELDRIQPLSHTTRNFPFCYHLNPSKVGTYKLRFVFQLTDKELYSNYVYLRRLKE